MKFVYKKIPEFGSLFGWFFCIFFAATTALPNSDANFPFNFDIVNIYCNKFAAVFDGRTEIEI